MSTSGSPTKLKRRFKKLKSKAMELSKIMEETSQSPELNPSEFSGSESEEGEENILGPNWNYGSAHFNWGFDQMKSRELLAKMIMAHELPFQFVEYEGFNMLASYNNPFHHRVSAETIKTDCVKVFESEKEKLKEILSKTDRVSIACDFWASNQFAFYMRLVVHYIDSYWKLQKRIIQFDELSPPYSGVEISDSIIKSLMEWNIQEKIGTITIENVSNFDKAADFLKDNFEVRNKLHFHGLFFKIKCVAQVLNLIVQDGLSKIENCISKIRQGVIYLRNSPFRLEEFEKMAKNSGISTEKSLWIDVPTRWVTTHRMIKSAIYYKSEFNDYALRDLDFKWCPTETEWQNSEKVCKLLDYFTEISNLFIGKNYPTSNLYLIKMYKVKNAICEAHGSTDSFMREIGREMLEKFEKYWAENSWLISIASVLDPRFKLKLVEFSFAKLYSKDELNDLVKEVLNKLQTLFEIYSKDHVSSFSSPIIHDDVIMEIEEEYFAFVKSTVSEPAIKSDLQIYLEEPVLLKFDEFDVLDWWKVNNIKYPVLSKLAQDILFIPFSTVPFGADFDAGERVLDDYKSALSNELVEVLVCGGDWIRAGTESKSQISSQAGIEEEGENLEVRIMQDEKEEENPEIQIQEDQMEENPEIQIQPDKMEEENLDF